jgi:hypothetical protein
MKKETNTTTKGELLQDKYSKGKWTALFSEDINIFPEVRRVGDLIAICPNEYVSMEEAEANAEFICQAVNERQKLLDRINDEETRRISAEVALEMILKDKKALVDSNRELINEVQSFIDNVIWDKKLYENQLTHWTGRLRNALNNAKELNK